MSVNNKQWEILNVDETKSTFEKLLANRGIEDQNEQKKFFETEYTDVAYSPFLLKDMTNAVERVQQAIEKGERIMIFGDYDVDGISSTAIMMYTLNLLGAQASYRLPNRVTDGYGLNMRFIEEFKDVGVDLVITVDCGVSCAAEIAQAKKYGIDVIITDHHDIPPTPPEDACAIVHPLQKSCPYPFKGLVGAGVALKFAEALLDGIDGMAEHKKLLVAFASMGTVADMGPLLGENRGIVKTGVANMKTIGWQGIRSLKKVAGLKEAATMTAMDIGFRIGPRINAAGRIGSPYVGVKLLLSNDKTADQFAQKLDVLNKQRQEMTQESMDEIESALDAQLQEQTLLIASSERFHTGIVGLLAGKMTEKYARPSIVMEEREDEFVGSARSPKSFSMIEALREQASLLSRYGGHRQAAGFTIPKENVATFIENIQSYANEKLEINNLKSTIEIDCELAPEEVNFEFFKELKKLEPFGIGNTEPIFIIKNVEAKMPRRVGNNKQHLQFSVELGGKTIKTIGFNLGEYFNVILESEQIDVVCALNENTWNNTVSLQLRVLDFGWCKEPSRV